MARIFDKDCAGSPFGVHRHHFPLRHAPSWGQGTLSRPGEYQRQVCTHLIHTMNRLFFCCPILQKVQIIQTHVYVLKNWSKLSYPLNLMICWLPPAQVPKGVCVRQPLLAASPDDQLHSCACQIQVVRVHNPNVPGSDKQMHVSCACQVQVARVPSWY